MLVFTMPKIKAHSSTRPQYPTFLSLSQADLSYERVLLCWLKSHRPMYLEAFTGSLPVNWVVTGLFWTFIYGLLNLLWWSNAAYNGMISLMSCGAWGSKFTAPSSRLLGFSCCQVEPEVGNTGDESIALEKNAAASFQWYFESESIQFWSLSWCLVWCLAVHSAWAERAGSTAGLLPAHEICFEVSEAKKSCWCVDCWHAKLCSA